MQSYKLLENNKGEQMNLGMANFFDTTKGMIMKERTDKLNFIKMKQPCSAKDNEKTSHRMRT